MQTVAPVTQVLHKPQRKSLIYNCNITFWSIRKAYGIPMQICQSGISVYLCLRECGSVKHKRQSKISIRYQHLAFQVSYCTACCNDMQGLLQNAKFC